MVVIDFIRLQMFKYRILFINDSTFKKVFK
jgi:hypothetical protein